ncbi:lipoprotein LpqH [Mycobacterium haemophilum]|uniref:lipoprotein LpqH n=1 Tax=Mycobacterium haemophilum TaxID=29311 RepID=UPI001E638710|nr:lipoprotein LpqH [Mycobacterium haemophilum]
MPQPPTLTTYARLAYYRPGNRRSDLSLTSAANSDAAIAGYHRRRRILVRHELLVAVGAITIVAGAAGCSGGSQAPAPSSRTTTSSSATTSSGPTTVSSSTAAAAAGEAKVTIGGQPQNVSGPVVCSTTNGKFSIAIGDMITGVIVGLEPDASVVHNAGLGTIDGVVMAFTEGVPGENASATKNGNTYQITGTASGVDNAGQQVHKPFEIEATCR